MKALAILLLAACTTFEDPTLVIDLRVIAMTASPPEQVVDLDPANPDLSDIIDQLQPSFVCATVADPRRAGFLHWSMRACLIDNGRCDPTRPSFEIASGVASDPESSATPICATITPSPDLVALLVDSLSNDQFGGAAGVTYSVELAVGDLTQEVFATKELRVLARFPESRVPNRNPTLIEIQLQSPSAAITPIGNCASAQPRLRFLPRQQLAIVPVERSDTRENYPTPTLDGSFQFFDETIRYQYLTTAGSIRDEFTGGPPDFVGNEAGLSTRWTAPEVDEPLDVQIWMIQRDERGGVSLYPFCVRVAP